MGVVYTPSDVRMQPGKILAPACFRLIMPMDVYMWLHRYLLYISIMGVAMVIKPLVVIIAISLGGWLGWVLGRPWGIMIAYFIAVAGASVGLYVGRRIQYHLDDD